MVKSIQNNFYFVFYSKENSFIFLYKVNVFKEELYFLPKNYQNFAIKLLKKNYYYIILKITYLRNLVRFIFSSSYLATIAVLTSPFKSTSSKSFFGKSSNTILVVDIILFGFFNFSNFSAS
jgi:hypothetical protein